MNKLDRLPYRKRNETHETLLARARRYAPPRARWTDHEVGDRVALARVYGEEEQRKFEGVVCPSQLTPPYHQRADVTRSFSAKARPS